MRISTDTTTTTIIDAEGNQQTTTVEKTHKVEPCQEPNYIKIYTNMWCEFNQIPIAHRPLFLELVVRMSYCNKQDLSNSQIVATGGPFADSICNSLHWQNKVSLKKGLKALCDCGAIKRVSRGYYQINPSYAGKGEWKYNPRFNQGGIEDLVATFNFKEKTVKTEIVWADDGSDSEINLLMRQGIPCEAKDHAVMTETIIGPSSDDPFESSCDLKPEEEPEFD